MPKTATRIHNGPVPGTDQEDNREAGSDGLSGRVPYTLAASALLILHLTLMIGALRSTSVTVDEFGHLPAGYAYLTTGQTGWLTMNPPLQPGLAALPLLIKPRPVLDVDLTRDRLDFWELGRVFLEQNRANYHALFMRARITTAALSVITGLLVLYLARAAAGPRAGLIALFLYALSPDFLAHGGLVTADQGAALAGAATVATLLHYRRRPTPARLILAGAAVSLTLLSKFSALLFLPLVPATLIMPLPPGSAGPESDKVSPARASARLAVIAAVAWIITLAAYRFDGVSAGLPRAWLDAFGRQLAEHSGAWTTYLFGELSYRRAPHYYLVCLLYKSPPALLLLVIFGLARLRRGNALRAAWSLGPGLWFLAMISLSPAKQIGARMALPALAFIIVFAGAAAAEAAMSRSAWLRAAAAALLVWCAAGAVRAYPDYISYFNELAGGPGRPNRGYEVLADSNLDWGQDLIRLAEWQRERGVPELWLSASGLVDPAVYGVNYRHGQCRPRPGWNAVSVGLALGMDEFMERRECYANFHNLTPADRVGASIWIYHLGTQ